MGNSHIDRRDRRQLNEDYPVGEGFGVLRGTIFQDIGSHFLNQVPVNSPFRRRGDRYSFPQWCTKFPVDDEERDASRENEWHFSDTRDTRGRRLEIAHKAHLYWILINFISFSLLISLLINRNYFLHRKRQFIFHVLTNYYLYFAFIYCKCNVTLILFSLAK